MNATHKNLLLLQECKTSCKEEMHAYFADPKQLEGGCCGLTRQLATRTTQLLPHSFLRQWDEEENGQKSKTCGLR